MALDIDLEKLLEQVNTNTSNKLKSENSTFTADPRILKVKPGNAYYMRLVPYTSKDGPELYKFYKEIAFQSRTTNKFVYCGRSLSDYDKSQMKNDLFAKTQKDEYDKVKNSGNKQLIREACKLIPKRKALVNVYLHKVEGDDEESKAKVGQVLAFPFTATVKWNKETKSEDNVSHILKILHEALEGNRKSKIGSRAFDLSENGRSLIIKVSAKAGDDGAKYPDFAESNFDDAEDIGLSATERVIIRNSGHDLNEFVPKVLSHEEARQVIDEHWHGTTASAEDELSPDELDDAIPTGTAYDDAASLLD